jgi:hypothetical protein
MQLELQDLPMCLHHKPTVRQYGENAQTQKKLCYRPAAINGSKGQQRSIEIELAMPVRGNPCHPTVAMAPLRPQINLLM